jgi:hypothetical protein
VHVCSIVIIWCLLFGTSTAHAVSLKDIKRGKKLGLGLVLYNQHQPYQIDSLQLGVGGLDSTLIEGLEVRNETTANHFRIDYWVLPFLNVFGIVGQVRGKTEVNLQGIDIGLPFQLDNLVVPTDGTVYGAGLVLAVGGKHWFGTVAYNRNETQLDVAESSVKAQVITPRIGLHFSRGAVWIGGMYQDVEERHVGIFELPVIGEIPFDVTLTGSHPWNYVIGGTAGLTKHLVLILQGGFGKRKSALITLEYRMF